MLSSLGILPQAAEAIIPSYLARFRRTGQYEVQRTDVNDLRRSLRRDAAMPRRIACNEASMVCY